MSEKRRTAHQRLKYLRKGHAVRRVSDMPIWDWLQLIAKVPEPKARLIQSVAKVGIE
jgi:hypothetical protein